MKVCVYGCGAIGGLLAARLAASGAAVSVVARGKQLEAIRESGLRLLPPDGGKANVAHVAATDDPTEFPPQDVVFLTMKSHAVPEVAPFIEPLLGPETMVVTATNGIPWWYFYGLEGRYGSPELSSVDPGRRLWNAIGPERAIGCVVYPAGAVTSPGVVQHIFGDRFALGEPATGQSERLCKITGLLRAAEFDAPVQDDIRVDIWTKLVANAAFNPVSVMTGKSLGAMIDDPAVNSLLLSIMQEVVDVAAALGVRPALTPVELIDAMRALGAHDTSMLQDWRAGRALELGPVVQVVLELAAWRGVATPSLSMAAALVAEMSNKKGQQK